MAHHFTKAKRLISAAQYKNVFADANRLTTVGLVLLFRDNGLNYNRLGLAISKKHIKRAVQRNSIKRIIREHFRRWPSVSTGVDIVVLARAPLVHANSKQIHRQLGQLWEKLNKHYGS